MGRSRCDSVRSSASENYLKRNGSVGVLNILSQAAPEQKTVSLHRQTLSGALYEARVSVNKQLKKPFNAYCTINMSNLKTSEVKKPKSSVMRGSSLLGSVSNL